MVEVDCGEHGGTHVLHALPTKPVAKVELCSIKQVERDMRLGCEAWLMLIQPATHSFVSAVLVSKFSLPVKPGGDMEVTLADGSQVEVSQTCCVPLVVCSGDC